jgi:hypothetical protein
MKVIGRDSGPVHPLLNDLTAAELAELVNGLSVRKAA